MIKSRGASRVETIQFVLPEHLNQMGNMHGGETLKLMDSVAGLVFLKHCQGEAVTAGVKDVKMIRPIPKTAIVKGVGELIKTGRTSMEVKVEVWLLDLKKDTQVLATEGVFIGVGIDDEGKPTEVPKVQDN